MTTADEVVEMSHPTIRVALFVGRKVSDLYSAVELLKCGNPIG